MMAIVLKTGSNSRDINQHIGLDNLKSVVEHLYSQTLKQLTPISHLLTFNLITDNI
jgi:hypothetical protein